MKNIVQSIFGIVLLASVPFAASALSSPQVTVDEVQPWNARVEWNTVAGAQKYTIQVYEKNGQHVRTVTAKGSATHKYLKNLHPHTQYRMKINAQRGDAKSSFTTRYFTTKKISTDTNGLYTYQNKRLGIELSVPRKHDGAKKIRMIEEKNAVVVSKERKAKNRYYQLRAQGESPVEAAQGTPWAIVVDKAKSKSDVERFIDHRYGTACSAGEYRSTDDSATKRVVVQSDSADFFTASCPINYITYVFYSPRYDLVAAFDLGQSPYFILENGVEAEMVESFHFIKKSNS